MRVVSKHKLYSVIISVLVRLLFYNMGWSKEEDIKLLIGNLKPKSDNILVKKLGTRSPIIDSEEESFVCMSLSYFLTVILPE